MKRYFSKLLVGLLTLVVVWPAVYADVKWEETAHAYTDFDYVLQTVTNLSNGREVRLHNFTCYLDPGRIVMIDNSHRHETLSQAMGLAGATVGINGGSFDRRGNPIGLEIAGGRLVNGLQKPELLTGVFVASLPPKILRLDEYSSTPQSSDALQGQLLIDGGKPVNGLDDISRAMRTAIVITDGQFTPHLLVCEPVTLAEFAEIIVSRLRTGTRHVERALNLGGGTMSGIWIGGYKGTVYFGNPSVNSRNYVAFIEPPKPNQPAALK